MNGLFSAVTRISRFRHGEGGAATGDDLISMADIAPRALSQEPISAGAEPGVEFQKRKKRNQACPSLMRCAPNWRSI
jgi:hypothetical protein